MDKTIFLSDLNNYKYNFKNYLNSENSLIFRNCKNLKIIIKSKINKIILYNCKQISIQMYNAIIGIEFNKCVNVKLVVVDNINSFESFKSNIKCKIKNKNNVFFKNEFSKIKFISP